MLDALRDDGRVLLGRHVGRDAGGTALSAALHQDSDVVGEGPALGVAGADEPCSAWWSRRWWSSLVQWRHDDAVVGLWLDAPGGRLVSTSVAGTVRIWRVDGLEADPARLQQRLVAATLACIPAEQRMRELGEDRVDAEAGVARCRGGATDLP